MDFCVITAALVIPLGIYFIAKFCLFSEKISGQDTDSQGKRKP